jgi:uncharacterized protein
MYVRLSSLTYMGDVTGGAPAVKPVGSPIAMELAHLIKHLSDPRAYTVPTTNVDVHQTHISAVFVTDAFAYKIKKPIALDFLDYSTLEKRLHWCKEEVRLNRRLAPRIYLGVVPIVRDGQNVRVEGTGSVVEWAVKMHRLPAEANLARAIAQDDVSHDAVESLARRLAEFHHHAERNESTARFGRFDVVARNARDNLEQSYSQVGTTVSQVVFERLEALTEEALGRHRSMIEDRADRGIPCDAHGDIRMDHVYLFPANRPPDDLAIVDCIEFNVRFRAADPAADMAFLMMDLIRHGYRDQARRFRDAYLNCASDAQGAALVPFYVSYRAAVRGKVNGIKASSRELSASERTKAQLDARAQWLLALGSLEAYGRRPCLVLMSGLPGTGKSTLAHALASHAGFELVRSDQIRKELAKASGETGGEAVTGYASGIYTPEWNERTYEECFARADAALFQGKRSIVDASFRDESQRRRFLDLAAQWSVRGMLLICDADAAVVKRRLEGRRHNISDADLAIYLQAAQRWEPLGQRTKQFCHTIDTSRSGSSSLFQTLEILRQHELWDLCNP